VTGYLQRLVASAANVGAVHPVLRPIYSNTANAMPDDRGAGNAPAADMPRAGDPARPQSDQPPRSAKSLGQVPITETPSLARSPLPPRVTDPWMVAAIGQESRQPPDVEVMPMHRREPVPRHTTSEPQAAASSARHYAPLVSVSAHGESAPKDWRDDPPRWPHGVAAHSERDSIGEAARGRAREPDSVEIHIGRIEVTAVQPAPARVAPAKLARHAPSLEEFLKRRNGRAS
jgi:hypothetical protein